MDGQSETNKSPASTQHAGLFLEGASSPSHKKKTLPYGDVSVRILSQKKTLPFGDVFFWGARTDSNRRHSEPQSLLRALYPVDYHHVNDL